MRLTHLCGIFTFLWLIAPQVIAQRFLLPPQGENVVGALQTVVVPEHKTLLDLAQYYHVGYNEIRAANPEVDPWVPLVGTEIVIPTQYILPDALWTGIVINLAEMRLYYFPPPEKKQRFVDTFPIGIGRSNWPTPLGLTKVVRKVPQPTWYVPKSIYQEHLLNGDPIKHVVPPGPDNPLGQFALQLEKPGYLIHGTNKPYGIGMQVTHGCIRLSPEDIAELYQKIPVGTPVRVVNQPFKVGLRLGRVFLEVHHYDENSEPIPPQDFTPLMASLIKTFKTPVDERILQSAIGIAEQYRGIPVFLGDGPATGDAISTLE